MVLAVFIVVVLFFFQAEDGIRDYKVTGVQTCALPIARVTAASSPSALRTNDMPTDDPIFDGFTITGQPRAVFTSSGATGGGTMNQAGTGTPAARNSRLARSLSIASGLPSAPLPV